ncbi:hypothetical protein GWI34_02340 [Actinomadura sp. DSM 109109]|nr:hypothetical protein [Actinomadura lepetitiana]
MRARDLAVEHPTATPDGSALDAARLVAEHRLPGLIVVGPGRRPVAVVPGSPPLGSIMEVASVMAADRSPVVAVSGEADRTDAPMIGVITVAHFLDRLPPGPPS